MQIALIFMICLLLFICVPSFVPIFELIENISSAVCRGIGVGRGWVYKYYSDKYTFSRPSFLEYTIRNKFIKFLLQTFPC